MYMNLCESYNCIKNALPSVSKNKQTKLIYIAYKKHVHKCSSMIVYTAMIVIGGSRETTSIRLPQHTCLI